MESGVRGTRLYRWFAERFPVAGIEEHIEQKSVPRGRHFLWYFFGGTSLFFLLVQIVTGLFLLLYYKPTAQSAYESVHFIESEVAFGWLIRNIHAWSANLMILSLFFHLFSNWFTKGYRRPREATWVTGVLMLFLAMGFGFSGYLLPWNKLSFFATKVGTEIAAVTPFIGKFLLVFLRGGEDVTGATLTRFFGIHVAVLPMSITFLLVLHLYFVQEQGMSSPIGEPPEQTMKFVPHFLYRELAVWVFCLVLLMFLAVYLPYDSVFVPLELQEKASAFDPTPEGIRPEWYFIFMFQALKYFPGSLLGMNGKVVALLVFAAGALIMLLLPFWDRWARREERHWLPPAVGVFYLVFIIVFTILGYVLPGH
ncbi:MAG TPA: cytochrome bc complex cytochrome b subunit [Bacteroidetes bacterium]|nr:cytochrome bc complex cytochrome b subunit [Bacteroidota bacterium]